MAEHLASIFGTEKDRVNCPFYFKIGACRHGDRCSRLHTKPTISPTLVLSNMYQRPDMMTPGVDPQGQPLDPKKIQSHFEELSKYGDIQCLNICDNLADHMVGNVYIQFREEDQAMNALQNLMGRELRQQLFRKSRRHGRSRSRSHSPPRRDYDERRGGSGRSGDHRHHDRGRRPHNRNSDYRSGRSRSPRGRRNRSPVRESSAERRAKIELWNKEREEADSAIDNSSKIDDVNRGHQRNDSPSNAKNPNPSEEENGNYDF
ncbi:hypothetical protein DH2020_014967 [Rehmannia glutinosa]|uniref:Uncharacterized protein n=1 Tax=Rehmannia glutinosa TaxID=99300 RepID=A0ABR0WY15_REHGL